MAPRFKHLSPIPIAVLTRNREAVMTARSQAVTDGRPAPSQRNAQVVGE